VVITTDNGGVPYRAAMNYELSGTDRRGHFAAQGANEARTDETLDGMRPRTLAGGNTREVP
jgi:hypothetical protein